MKDYERLKMLEYPQGIIDAVIDTDAATEVDDPFAIAYALCSKERLNIKGIYAAPFSMNEKTQNPEVGMNMSYDEINHILSLMHDDTKDFVYKGAEGYLKDNKPRSSEASKHLIKLSADYNMEHPLYVIAIGAITNIASAIILYPEIINRIVVVWLAGNDFDDSPNAYNVYQDVSAAQIIFNSGVPFIHVPCNYVASHLITSVPELEQCIGGKNELCNYLIQIVKDYNSDYFAWGKQIWDIAVIGYLLQESWSNCEITTAPMITDNITWSREYNRHLIKNVKKLDRDKIFRDMFIKLGNVRKEF